jgi:hypothetical protein
LTAAVAHDTLRSGRPKDGRRAEINSWSDTRVYTYLIPVRNEYTGEVRVVEVQSAHDADAQIQALHQLFKQEGWRKATALRPELLADPA